MIPKLCLTGGPCAGKTTALAYLRERLADRGFTPLVVPEAATLLMNGNVAPPMWGERVFQTAVIRTVINLEQSYEEMANARPDLKPVLLCDRGVVDSRAYISEELYLDILRDVGVGSHIDARDRRYTAVFHLVSAAKGAEAFYTTDNNPVRRETLAEARLADDRTLDAWIGAPHFRVIGNETDFSGKLARLDQEICAALGLPVPIEIERKFLCAPIGPKELPSAAQRIDIEQVYLLSEPDVVARVRKRGQNGSYAYFRTEKRFIADGINAETEHPISAEEYEWSLQFRRPDRRILRKTRTCFVHANQYFELDVIPTADAGVIHLLEIELTRENQEIKLPPFLKIIADVTDDHRYTNLMLAAKATRQTVLV